MVLVFIIMGIIIFILFIITILLLSTFQVEIKNLKIGSKKTEEDSRLKDEYRIIFSIYLFGKFKIFSLKYSGGKLKEIYNYNKLRKINVKEIEEKIIFKKENLYLLKKLKIELKKLNLKVDIGTEDAILTSYVVAIIASVIGIILPHVVELKDRDKCRYIINPMYRDKNEYQVYLDSIISMKIVHIIYIIYNLIKRRRDENGRTSNRRSYGYSYE